LLNGIGELRGQSKIKRQEPSDCCDGKHLRNADSNIRALKPVGREEPIYYPPSAYARLEACGRCGLLRLPPS
jgi:predicted small lipoprotein YifL